MIIAVSIRECTFYRIHFPKNINELEAYIQDTSTVLTGKVIVLDSNLPFYITDDSLELDFASRQPFLQIVKDEASIRAKRYIRDPERLPLIETNLTDEEIQRYLFIDPHEAFVREALIARGYIKDDTIEKPEKHPLDNFSKKDIEKYIREKYEKQTD